MTAGKRAKVCVSWEHHLTLNTDGAWQRFDEVAEGRLVTNYCCLANAVHTNQLRRLIAIPESGRNLKGTTVTEFYITEQECDLNNLMGDI